MGNFITKKGELRVINFDETNNGHFYYGQVSPNSKMPKGKGKYYFEDGSVYYGEFKNNEFNGQGILNSTSDGSVYKGNFRNNSREGNGELIFKNGDKYIGKFELDEMQGKGKYIYNNGCYYEGNFLMGKMSGKGKLFNQVDELVYDGEFLNNSRSGFGISYKNSKVNYIGNWFNDSYHGVGLVFDEKGILLSAGVFDSHELMEELDYVPEQLLKYVQIKELIQSPDENCKEGFAIHNTSMDKKFESYEKQEIEKSVDIPGATAPPIEPVAYNPLSRPKNTLIQLINPTTKQDPIEIRTEVNETVNINTKVVNNPIYSILNNTKSKNNIESDSPKSTFNPIQVAFKKTL